MPYVGQRIINPRTGQQLTFTQMTPSELRVESVNPPATEREPVHVHPKQ